MHQTTFFNNAATWQLPGQRGSEPPVLNFRDWICQTLGSRLVPAPLRGWDSWGFTTDHTVTKHTWNTTKKHHLGTPTAKEAVTQHVLCSPDVLGAVDLGGSETFKKTICKRVDKHSPEHHGQVTA